MTFLPDVLIKHLKEAMDPRENLPVVDLDSRYVASTQVLLLTNFSAAMSNVDSLERRLYAPDKPWTR